MFYVWCQQKEIDYDHLAKRNWLCAFSKEDLTRCVGAVLLVLFRLNVSVAFLIICIKHNPLFFWSHQSHAHHLSLFESSNCVRKKQSQIEIRPLRFYTYHLSVCQTCEWLLSLSVVHTIGATTSSESPNRSQSASEMMCCPSIVDQHTWLAPQSPIPLCKNFVLSHWVSVLLWFLCWLEL